MQLHRPEWLPCPWSPRLRVSGRWEGTHRHSKGNIGGMRGSSRGTDWTDKKQPTPSSIELPSLDIDTVLPHGTTQILHGQHRPSGAPPTASSIPGSLLAQHMLTHFALPPFGAPWLNRPASTSGAGARDARGGGRGRVSGTHPGVLVSVGRNIGDELLRRQSQQASQGKRGGRGWRKAGEGQVVCRYGVRDLERFKPSAWSQHA